MPNYSPNISVPGFEDHQISVVGGGLSAARLFVDGQPAPQGAKRGQFQLRRSNGQEVVASFKNAFPDPVPILVIEGQQYRLAPPLATLEWIWVAFPLVLIILGGAIGGGLGAVGATVNAQIFRAQKGALRYVLTALVSLTVFILWLTIVSLIRRPR